jgi:hypothetical protein
VVAYKKGDLWKALLLITMIAAAFWFSFRTLRNASGARPTPAPGSLAGAIGPAGEQALVDPSIELFAPRERPTTQLLIRAHAAPDPFRPYLSLLPVQAAALAKAAAAKKATPTVPSAAEEVAAHLRLVGIISGVRPTAVLVGGDGHHYVRQGDTLPGGWRIAQVDQRGVILTKGSARARLGLQKEPAPTK